MTQRVKSSVLDTEFAPIEGGTRMKFIVCVKLTPDTEQLTEVQPR